MAKHLTKRQSQILEMIRTHISKTGYPPTRRNIADEFDFKSLNAAEEHLRALARKGAIQMDRHTSRGIRVTSDEDMGTPVIGRVAAGSPVLAVENVETRYNIPDQLFYPKADYLLRVRGDSMVNVGIFDDDLLAVHKTQNVHNGQIVIARVENEVTVKRFERDDHSNTIKLLSENPKYEPIVIDTNSHEFHIEGLSVGVIRQSF